MSPAGIGPTSRPICSRAGGPSVSSIASPSSLPVIPGSTAPTRTPRGPSASRSPRVGAATGAAVANVAPSRGGAVSARRIGDVGGPGDAVDLLCRPPSVSRKPLVVASAPGRLVITYFAEPGSPSAEALAALQGIEARK
jgi:hypothetical protein